MDGIKTKLKNVVNKYLIDHCPQRLIDRMWQRTYGFKVDWNHPRDINEKIQWQICFGDTSKWPDLADKYKVRDYIKGKGYEHILTQLYGVWDDARKIDIDALPDKFVLKCNHDCGSTILIDKQKGVDRVSVIDELNNHMSHKFGYIHCEPHYNKIRPLIMAEEMLENTDTFSTSMVDYKVWCFDGKPYCVFGDYGRTHEHLYTNVYDLNWQVHPEWSVFTNHFLDGGGRIPRPDKLEEMLKIASDLSVGHPQVRVDFYIVKGKIYFGEMTFTSACGRMDYFTPEFLKVLGAQVKLPNT